MGSPAGLAPPPSLIWRAAPAKRKPSPAALAAERPPLQRATSPATSRLIQRVEDKADDRALARVADQLEEAVTTVTDAAEAEASVAEPDLDDLARQVYPLIKRMLAIERERRPAW